MTDPAQLLPERPVGKAPFCIIIAAHTEEGDIGPCLDTLLARYGAAGAVGAGFFALNAQGRARWAPSPPSSRMAPSCG
ncbi:MAG: hypothetical protein H5U24_13120 [Thioclava marina]|uniref:hypothetical protein n=1 Tax=Thioclava marina TaxID=1915077 RepID=UPI0019909776|nr:hypothetical protein [Thioclava marina]MBC7146332.1 hypothetical protein [Thioclava marina]